MAKVIQENIGKFHEKISVTLTAADYEKNFNDSLKKQSKNATIPGFRKGMVPAGMIKKMYGSGIFVDELNRLASKEMEKHLRENKIEFLAQPLPAESQAMLMPDMNSTKDYVFDFEIASVPSFDIDLFQSGKALERFKINLKPEMIEEEVERFQYKVGKMTEPETVSVADNVLNVKFTESDALGNVVENGISKDNSLLMKYFSADAQKEWMGKKNGDSITLKIGEAFEEKVNAAVFKDLELDEKNEEHNSKHFNISLEKLGLVEKAAFDENLFEQSFPGAGIKTEEEFRAKVQEDMQNYWAHQARMLAHNEIFEELVHTTSFDLPDAFLKRFLLMTNEKYKSENDVEADYGSFTHQIRWELIFKKLVEENQIDATPQEVEMATKQQLASYFGMAQFDENADWVKGFVQKQLSDRDFYEKTYRQILSDKVFSVLENKIPFTEKEIGVDEFIAETQKGNKHHHHH